MQKHNPEVSCDIAEHFVLSNCSSKFSVGRDLYMYPTLHNGNKIMRENRHDVRLLLLFSKKKNPLNVCFISMHLEKTVKKYKRFRQKTFRRKNVLWKGWIYPPPLI